MDKVTDKKVKTTLVGVNGNVFCLMAHFKNEARKQKWTKDEIDAVIKQAMSSADYDELIVTLDSYCER